MQSTFLFSSHLVEFCGKLAETAGPASIMFCQNLPVCCKDQQWFWLVGAHAIWDVKYFKYAWAYSENHIQYYTIILYIESFKRGFLLQFKL